MSKAQEKQPASAAKEVSRYGLGFVFEESPKDQPSTLGLFGAAGVRALPSETFNRNFVRRVYDQGPTNSCVGNALSQACDVRFRKLGLDRSPPARKAIYDGARTRSKAQVGDAMKDTGCSALQAFLTLAEDGVPTEADVPLDPATINQDMTFAQVAKGTTCFIAGWWEIPVQGSDRTESMAQAHAKGYPVVFALSVDRAFEDHATGTLASTDPAKSLGWHMLCSLDYRVRDDGKREFLIVNSWGEGWGERGYAWVHENLLAAGIDCVRSFFVVEVLP